MATIRCVEPANAVPGGDHFLAQVGPGNELLFPHVDSCLAIAMILSDGRVIGGHVVSHVWLIPAGGAWAEDANRA